MEKDRVAGERTILNGADSYEAWNQQDHANLFGEWDRYSTAKLISLCSQFNECQLVQSLANSADCSTLSDLGCATGRFYRFFRKTLPSLNYRGFDISQVAIQSAQARYPGGDFRVFDGDPKSQEEIRADVVFCRDVVHHQTDPRAFLSGLYDVANRYVVLRVRTREEGTTVFDPNESCQYTYGRWVPYIVFNTSELTELLSSFTPSPARITVLRHPLILGGQNERYLPKELYYPETGTAETSLLIEKSSSGKSGNVSVTVETRPELAHRRWLRKVSRNIARAIGI